MKETLKSVLLLFRDMCLRNWGWKLLALCLALMMWSYIISTNPSITRDVTLSGVEVTVSGQSVLESRGLALLTDISNVLPDVRVRVQVSQASYARVSNDTVRVELDLSSIRQTGVQTVRLSCKTSYGSVAQIMPATVELEVEELDQRYVPVNVELVGEKDEAYWYNVSRTNPSVITVSGPSSVVRQLSSAHVEADVTGLTATYSRAEQFSLLDASGTEVTLPLTRSTASVSVTVDAFPAKQVLVDDDPETVTTGVPAEGFRVAAVVVSPEYVTVAGEQTLLDALESLNVNPVDITGASQSFSDVTRLKATNDFKYVSAAEISVTVYIAETDTSERFTGLRLGVVGKDGDVNLKLSTQTVDVRVSGPYSVVSALTEEDIYVSVDVTGLGAGSHEMAVIATVDNHPELKVECTPEVVQVTLLE